MLLYAIDRRRRVGGVTLRPGDLTFGYYWVGRPYNVYHWISPEGATIAFYFNICRDTKLRSCRDTKLRSCRDTKLRSCRDTKLRLEAGGTVRPHAPRHVARVEWTDLGVDLLVLPDGRTTWLDVETVRTLSPGDRRRVARARDHLTETHARITRAVARETDALRAAMRMTGRRRPIHRDARPGPE